MTAPEQMEAIGMVLFLLAMLGTMGLILLVSGLIKLLSKRK